MQTERAPEMRGRAALQVNIMQQQHNDSLVQQQMYFFICRTSKQSHISSVIPIIIRRVG